MSSGRIAEINRLMRAIEKKTGVLHGEEWRAAVSRYDDLHRELGRLLIARDKAERPHIYRRERRNA